MYIEQVNSPQDIKQFSAEQLRQLAGEVRNALLTKLSAHGGHVGPNLGMVEATIALHYVFNSPTDKMVYDVSHQSYTHKTGIILHHSQSRRKPDLSSKNT